MPFAFLNPVVVGGVQDLLPSILVVDELGHTGPVARVEYILFGRGVAKTTLSGHLAVEAVRVESGTVVLIDTDSQGSLSQWRHERKAETPHLAQVEPAKLKARFATLKLGVVDIAIIDTPPAVTETNRQVIALASLVLIPTRPSPYDLRAVGSTIGMAEEAKKK